MIFDSNIPVFSIIFFSVALIGLFYIVFIYGYKLRVVRQHRRKCDIPDDSFILDLPKVSVIVYTHNEDLTLAESLPIILEQDYPGHFEVIVVNDGTANESDLLVTQLKNKYKNLYLTFAPDNSRNVSRKKLAITLGAKAAKGDIIVVTDSTTLVPSSKWLQELARPFTNPGTEVVLGYNRLNMPIDHWGGRLVIAFDYIADSVTWLSAAIKGHPYRGCGNNIAYRRDLFFRNKGFSQTLNLRNGDDDLFVNEISNNDNTVVQLSTHTIGTAGNGMTVRKDHRKSRRDHAFTGRMLPKASRRIMALGEWMMWLVPACALVGAYYAGITNIFGWALAALLIIIEYVAIVISWRKTILSLGGPRIMLTLPFIAAFRPLRNIKTNLLSGRRRNQCYTWQ